MFISEVESALESGWIISLCQHLSIEISNIYKFIITTEFGIKDTDETDLEEDEKLSQWITAYSECLKTDHPRLTERNLVVLVNVLLLRIIKVYLLANPVLEPHVLNLREAVPHWPEEALNAVKPTPFK